MEVKNCKKCGKMFNYLMGEQVCPNCKEAREAVFQKVKKYVQDNKKATIEEIVENCDVDAKQVKQWIREERLYFSDESPIKISCEGCGTQISAGRFCDKCRKDAVANFGNVVSSARAKSLQQSESSSRVGSGMHIR